MATDIQRPARKGREFAAEVFESGPDWMNSGYWLMDGFVAAAVYREKLGERLMAVYERLKDAGRVKLRNDAAAEVCEAIVVPGAKIEVEGVMVDLSESWVSMRFQHQTHAFAVFVERNAIEYTIHVRKMDREAMPDKSMINLRDSRDPGFTLSARYGKDPERAEAKDAMMGYRPFCFGVQSKMEPSQTPECEAETAGTRMARSLRSRCNTLTPAGRTFHLERAMQMIDQGAAAHDGILRAE